MVLGPWGLKSVGETWRGIYIYIYAQSNILVNTSHKYQYISKITCTVNSSNNTQLPKKNIYIIYATIKTSFLYLHDSLGWNESAILFVGNQETRLKQSSACSVPQVGLWKIDESCAMGGKGPVQIWVFPEMVVPPFHTPKWSFLVGKPMVVGYHNFRKPPYVVKATLWRLPVGGCFLVKIRISTCRQNLKSFMRWYHFGWNRCIILTCFPSIGQNLIHKLH